MVNPACLILGDNIFFGRDCPRSCANAAALTTGAIVFAYPVRDPERYGVMEFDEQRQSHQPGRKTGPTPLTIMPFPDCISMMTAWWDLPNPQALASAVRSRSPT